MPHTQSNLDLHEDIETLTECITNIDQWLESGRVNVLTHSHLADAADPRNKFLRSEEPQQKTERILQGIEKRFVVKCPTNSGIRILKFFHPIGLANRLYYAFTASPSQQAHLLHLQAAQKKILLPHSLGYLNYRDDRSLYYSAQVLEYLENMTSLGTYVTTKFNESNSDEEKRLQVIKELALLLVDIHQKGFYHPDLKPYHLFLAPRQSEKKPFPSILLLDIDRARFYEFIPLKYRINNLYQFYRYMLFDCSENERFHFLNYYCEAIPEETFDTEDLFRKVQHLNKKKRQSLI